MSKYTIMGIKTNTLKRGQKYYHFKNPETIYTIVALAKDTSHTDRRCVVYRSRRGTFVRDLDEFLQVLMLSDGAVVERFTKVE